MKPAGKSKVVAALETAARSSLCRRGAATIFVSMLLICTALVYPLLRHSMVEHRQAVIERTTDFLVTVAGEGRFPTVDVLVAAGRKLVAGTDIAGGVFVNSQGEERGVFGERPRLTWAAIRLSPDGNATYRVVDGHFHEFFIPPSRAGISFGTIVRVDGRGLWAAIRYHLIEYAILALAATLAITVVGAGVMAAIVIEPAMRIREALMRARDAPHEARSFLTGLGGSSEFGQMARAMDGVLSVIESLQVDDALTPRAVMEKLPNAVVARDVNGQVVLANDSALSLFGMHVIGDFESFDWNRELLIEGQAGRLDILLETGRFRTGAEVMRNGEALACLVSGAPIIDGERRGVGSCLIFTEANELLADMRQERRQREEAEAVCAVMRKRSFELKQLLDGCVGLLAGNIGGGKNMTVNPDRFVSNWLESGGVAGGVAGGAVSGVRHGVLPPVMGDPQTVRRLFEWALAGVAIRSGNDAPALAIDTEIDGDGNIEYVFRELSPGNPKATAPINAGTDITVLIGAMQLALEKHEGKLTGFGGGRGGNMISIALPLDAVGLAVLETERKRQMSNAA